MGMLDRNSAAIGLCLPIPKHRRHSDEIHITELWQAPRVAKYLVLIGNFLSVIFAVKDLHEALTRPARSANKTCTKR